MVQRGKAFGYYVDPATGVSTTTVSIWDRDNCLCNFSYDEGLEYLELMASFYKEKILSMCSVDDIKDELKRRGYTGTLSKNEIIEV